MSALLIGEMENELTIVQMALVSMIANVNDLDVEPSVEHAIRSLIRKTIVAEAARRSGGAVPPNAAEEATPFHGAPRHGIGSGGEARAIAYG